MNTLRKLHILGSSAAYDRPKLAYALKNRGVYPVDVGDAGVRELMMVPGIGLKTAQRIVAARDSNLHIRSLIPRKALPFLEV
ncbi:MAG: helix-hairpin-helix domain-containing protein, partial [Candidatus Altiarchaeota archaeon]|nr:helix-hairpin-helix domain-containing protein [Candidatus Altiarchaeota archaeon]